MRQVKIVGKYKNVFDIETSLESSQAESRSSEFYEEKNYSEGVNFQMTTHQAILPKSLSANDFLFKHGTRLIEQKNSYVASGRL